MSAHRAAGWCTLLWAGSALAAPVEVTYTIRTSGTGPGLENVTRAATVATTPKGSCNQCEWECLEIPGIPHLPIKDIAQVPVGQTNLSFQVTTGGGGTYVQTGGWWWSTYGCQGVNAGGGPESGGEIRVPVGCDFGVNMAVNLVHNHCHCVPSPFGGCIYGCNGVPVSYCAHTDSMTLSVTYKRWSLNAEKTCQQNGTGTVELDGGWHRVASATCMTAPDIATDWICSAATNTSGASVECRMVSNPANPEGGKGPHLIVKVEPPPVTLALSVSHKDLLPSGAKAQQTAMVIVQVTSAGAPAAGKVVKLTLSPTANPGHEVEAHTNNGSSVRTGNLSAGECTTDASGGCTVTYHAAQAAAEVAIMARLADDESVKDETSVKVGVSLGQIPASGVGYVFKPASKHASNLGASSNLAAAAAEIGSRYAAYAEKNFPLLSDEQKPMTAVRIRYTDASLERGGLYDIGAAWASPHKTHRFGRDLDIAKRGINQAGQEFVEGNPVNVPTDWITRAMKDALGTEDLYSPPNFPIAGGIYDEDAFHYHIRVLEAEAQL